MAQRVEVDGGALLAHVRGHVGEVGAPTLVFLHYWGGSHRTWNPVLDRLATDTGVVTYDHRGWGESRELAGPFNLTQLADDAQRVIERVVPRHRGSYVLVGHSRPFLGWEGRSASGRAASSGIGRRGSRRASATRSRGVEAGRSRRLDPRL